MGGLFGRYWKALVGATAGGGVGAVFALTIGCHGN